MLMRYFGGGSGISEQVFFYDLSERKLFPGPRTGVPPIRGVNDSQLDGVRAVVVSTTGKPHDKQSWKIAYLEKYAPEMKAQMEAAQKTGAAPQFSRAEAQEMRFVRRPEEERWFPMSSPEAELIVTQWATPGPNGITPVVCTP